MENTRDEMKEKLIRLLNEADEIALRRGITDRDEAIADNAEYLIEKGVSVPLAAVGDEIFVIMVKKAPGEGRYNRGFIATSPVHLTLDAEFEIVKKVCVKSDLKHIGSLAFISEEMAREALGKARNKNK